MGWEYVETFLQQAQALIGAGRVRYTRKSDAEIVDLGIDRNRATQILLALHPDDFDSTLHGIHELFVFLPETDLGTLYIKLAIDGPVVVVSFHLEGQYDDDDDV